MNNLIKPFLGIFLIVALSYSGFAQRRVLVPVEHFNTVQRPAANTVARAGGGKRVQAVKENFLSKQLNLNPQEAKAFWPMYRQYQQELTAVRVLKRINNSNSTTDGAKQVDLDLEYETKLVDIKKHYRDEFYKVLPPEKVSILYKSEREFNDEMVKILSERSVRAGD